MSRPEPLFVVHASSGVPIYRQLVDQVEALVAGGRLRPGDVVPSVRQVATALGINPMTVSKAWGRLESDGVLIRDRGRGMVVAARQEPASLADRRVEVQPLVDRAVTHALHLGLTPAQLLAMVRESLKEHRSCMIRPS
ncbi:MAG: GntR family transcriptional regulator [Planctomycetota bacterium]|jgi:GntR family transcriptional regulator